MNNLKDAYNKHPSSAQPNRTTRNPQPPLPLLTRPSTGGSSSGGPSLPTASSSGDVSSAITEQATSPDVLRSAPFPGYTRQVATSYTSGSSAANLLSSPSQDPVPRPHSALGDSSSTTYNHQRYFHSPQHSETYDSASRRHPSGPSHAYSTSGPATHPYGDRDEPVHGTSQTSRSYAEPHSEAPASVAEHLMRGPRTPPRSPVVATSSDPSSMVSPNTPGAAFAQRGAIDEDSGTTVRADDRTWLKGFIDEMAAEGTTRPRPKPPMPPMPPPPTAQLPTPPLTDASTFHSTSVSTFKGSSKEYEGSDDSDSSQDRGTIWAKPPSKPASSQQSTATQKPRSCTRPPLTPLSIESSPASGPNALPLPPPLPNFPLRLTLSPRRTRAHRKFDNNFDMTWAPRPPPEVMYERLEEYFPEHDLDKPVIETPSGGTSPTSTEAPAMPAPQRSKHKKSIRHVAAEHKRQLDRTSRGDESTVAPLSRKRNTKLWGSKLEEVTTQQGKGPTSSVASDSSPGGNAKPIFRWVRGELIGKGTYGRVYLALNATTGEMIAVKQVEIPRTASDKDDSRQVSVVEALKLESETLKDLDHPNIVQYLGFEETPTFLSIFLEYVPGGSIASCLRKHGRFDEEVTKSFTGQILSGLEYLHSRGILHRDLKADNILVETSGVCKISDFGISKRTDDINMAAMYTSMQGTVFWMAPEVVNSKGKGYNSKIDIWSVGCVVFEMWTGQRPWSGQEAMAVLLHLYQTKQAPPVPPGIELSPLADDFRLKCFAADPDERPSAAELRRHPYLELQPGWTFNGFK
ncbi:kinase-like domain-containing protein [Trametes punicea]|nr:kinase-like domain-containing protein [Trametes punicea]